MPFNQSDDQSGDRPSKPPSKPAKRPLVVVPMRRSVLPGGAEPKEFLKEVLKLRKELLEKEKEKQSKLASVKITQKGNDLLVIAPDRSTIELWYREGLQNSCSENSGLKAHIWYRTGDTLKRYCAFVWP